MKLFYHILVHAAGGEGLLLNVEHADRRQRIMSRAASIGSFLFLQNRLSTPIVDLNLQIEAHHRDTIGGVRHLWDGLRTV